MVIVVVAVVTATVAMASQVLRREVLDEAALGEVVPVGVVELAPLATVPVGRSGLPFSTPGFPLGGGFGRPSAARPVAAFRLFASAPGFRPSRVGGSSGGTPMLDPGVRLSLQGVLVRQCE